MKEKMMTQLKWIFYLTIPCLAVFFVAIAFRWIDFSIYPQPLSSTAERYILLLTIITIPSALWLFKEMTRKSRYSQNEKKQLDSYRKAYLIRLFILSFVLIINMIAYGVSLKQNFMLCTLILFVTFVFCKPLPTELDNPNQTYKK